ncbi:MAG: AAA domain-containing protein [Terrisporobacter sp.]
MSQDKDKILKLYGFLKQYNDIKNPIILDIDNQKWNKKLDNIPKHQSIENNIYDIQETDTLLSVKKTELKNCPNPPKSIEEWIDGDWNNPRKKVTNKKVLEKNNPNYDITDENSQKQIIINFEDDGERVEYFEMWNSKRVYWAETEVIVRDCDDLYNELFSLYSELKKESESVELVFGDGNLFSTNPKYKYINHPILIQSMKLEFDANTPEFSLVIGDKEPELYKSIFNIFTDTNHEILRDIYKEFDDENISPNDLLQSNSFLTRVANAISSKGKFVEDFKDIDKGSDYPQIYKKPILFLRKRNLGFGVAIDSIIEDIDLSYDVPSFLKDIVGIEDTTKKSKEANNEDISEINPNGIDKDILLTKPANAEQLTVAKHLERNGAVLVQGPPGTGKTHTIANMVGHLLSQGKSILVTSYSEKALSVLKEKVTENLQSLCLSLLSTTESRTEMEKTLDEINENRSRLEVNSLRDKIDRLESSRKEYITRLNNLKLQLKNARMSEYTPIVIGGKEYTPIEAAKFIKENNDNASWIPSPVELGQLPSLTNEEIDELYKSNISISEDEEIEYDCSLPNVKDLVTPIDFSNLINNKKKFEIDKLEENLDIWKRGQIKYSIDDLRNTINDIKISIEAIDLDTEWKIASIEDSKESVLKNNWLNLIKEINDVYKLSINVSEDILKYGPNLVGIDDKIDVQQQLDGIIERLQSGGKLSKVYLLLNQATKKFINCCRVNGNIPASIDEYRAINKYYNLENARLSLKNRWDRQIVVLGADKSENMGTNLEITCKKYCNIIERNLQWYEKEWNPIIKKVSKYGIDISIFNNKVDLSTDKYSSIKFINDELGERLINLLESEIYRMEYEAFKEKQSSLERTINKYVNNRNSNIIKIIQSSIINEDIDLYKEAYESIQAIKELSGEIIRRRTLLRRLENTAPKWANEIRNRTGDFGKKIVNGSINEAWKFRQFVDVLENRNSISIENIQFEISNLENILRNNTAELAFNKAWLNKLIQLEDNKSQIQSIEGWRQLIRKIGAGKGKKADKLKAEARKLMPQCQSAVPVWIMPINKVVENFNPKQNKFDVVIIDEASQADVMALVALYLGKQAIIVGDNEQVSPLAIGEKTDDVERLSREYLYDIPNHFLYSGKFSIYDLAQASGYQPIRLKEHFRCVPDIIEYSNIISYKGQIKPLRDVSDLKIDQSIITYKVQDAISNNKTNEKEAEAIVSLILSCCEQPEYIDMTFGVITLRGEKQADLINRMLQSNMSPIEYGKRNILCGKPANFQGDERDVIFLSMVDTNDKETPMRLNGYGPDEAYKKRYNVAMSRARDQVWLVHSLDVENDLKVGDIRKELLGYCNNYKSRNVEYEKNALKADSEFEKRAMKYLIDKGYKVVPQWEVGSYRIDMVVMDKDNKIALECDGERWHGEDRLEEDMNRQSILERLGWRFIRIRGSEFFKDEETAMRKVLDKLDSIEIYPNNSFSEVPIDYESCLKDKVIIRAQSIRDEWYKK